MKLLYYLVGFNLLRKPRYGFQIRTIKVLKKIACTYIIAIDARASANIVNVVGTNLICSLLEHDSRDNVACVESRCKNNLSRDIR